MSTFQIEEDSFSISNISYEELIIEEIDEITTEFPDRRIFPSFSNLLLSRTSYDLYGNSSLIVGSQLGCITFVGGVPTYTLAKATGLGDTNNADINIVGRCLEWAITPSVGSYSFRLNGSDTTGDNSDVVITFNIIDTDPSTPTPNLSAIGTPNGNPNIILEYISDYQYRYRTVQAQTNAGDTITVNGNVFTAVAGAGDGITTFSSNLGTRNAELQSCINTAAIGDVEANIGSGGIFIIAKTTSLTISVVTGWNLQAIDLGSTVSNFGLTWSKGDSARVYSSTYTPDTLGRGTWRQVQSNIGDITLRPIDTSNTDGKGSHIIFNSNQSTLGQNAQSAGMYNQHFIGGTTSLTGDFEDASKMPSASTYPIDASTPDFSDDFFHSIYFENGEEWRLWRGDNW